jgi:putative flavoprotein involved in K+ transport
MSPINESCDVLVIGAGQAGLAMGYHLRESQLSYQIVERHPRLGESWRNRYDSLVLFTPRAYSALPGLPVPGDPEGYPTKDEIADYLEAYASHFQLPVTLNTGIENLTQAENGNFTASTTSGQIVSATAVVIATGAFQQPVVPSIARELDPEVVQLTAATYRNPGQVPTGTVLIVGDGATGRQIAHELCDSHTVYLATGRPRRISRDRMLGKNLFHWMDRLGVLRASRDSSIGRHLMKMDPIPGAHLAHDRLRKAGVNVVGRLTVASGRRVLFTGAEATEIDAVIWASGYRDESDWVTVPGTTDARGAFIHEYGLSPIRNLTYIGRSWQRSRGSALLTGVGPDAAELTRHLVATLQPTGQPRDAGTTANVSAASGRMAAGELVGAPSN